MRIIEPYEVALIVIAVISIAHAAIITYVALSIMHDASSKLDVLRNENYKLKNDLADIEEYGTEEINAAVDLRHEIARLRLEQDESALRRLKKWTSTNTNCTYVIRGKDTWYSVSLVELQGDGTGGLEVCTANTPLVQRLPDCTEVDNDCTLPKIVDEALSRWEELYGE